MVDERYMTVEELRESFRKAVHKPGNIEEWALRHVERVLDRLSEAPDDYDSPTCPGIWLVYSAVGSVPQVYIVSEDDLVRYSNPQNGYLWYGPIPEAVCE